MPSRIIKFQVPAQVYDVLKSKAGLMSVNQYAKFVVLKEGARCHGKRTSAL